MKSAKGTTFNSDPGLSCLTLIWVYLEILKSVGYFFTSLKIKLKTNVAHQEWSNVKHQWESGLNVNDSEEQF